MVFNSLVFLVFFVVVYGMYRVLPRRGQNALIVISSYFFYGWWDWRFASLLAVTSLCSWLSGLHIDRYQQQGRARAAWWVSFANIALNLGILGFFKYFNFFVESLGDVLSAVGLGVSMPMLRIVLPVGISFYTFQALSYSIDVYRGEMKPTRDWVAFFAFVSFFPQLVAGPIERARNLLPQIERDRVIGSEDVWEGLRLVFWGLFKKVVVADNLAVLVDGTFAVEGMSGGAALMSVYAFAFQIFCDFSGYSDMARGLARMMGIDLMVNFRNPYFAKNPKEFWARWHISLSTWLKDYIYIPLGGNRRGARRQVANLWTTMLLGGLWHGAAWTFVIWGAFHGALLSIYHLWSRRFLVKRAPDSGRWAWSRRILMFHLACLGWVFFRAKGMGEVSTVLSQIFTHFSWDLHASNMLTAMILLCTPLWLIQLLQERTGRTDAAAYLSLVPRAALYALMAVMFLALANTGGGAFIYFQF